MSAKSKSNNGAKSKPYFKMLAQPRAAAASWSVPALCAAYNWPNGLTGGGVIGIVELDGGWVKSDMTAYFQSIGQPMPQITDVSVNGIKNNPNQHVGDPSDPDFEVALDIQVAAAAYYVATGKPAHIRIYWADDIAPGVQKAAADGCDVFSISWGNNEAAWRKLGKQAGQDFIKEMEDAAQAATAAGMTIFAASGDNDSGDSGVGSANVDVPSSCPHVIGCGGTKKTASSETVWNDTPGNAHGDGTGGGYSRYFPIQSFQSGAPNGPGRMVPDVAGNADMVTGYKIHVHGQQATVGGTSAVAPLYAGLFAAFGTKLGFVSPKLWDNHLCFNDISVGDNGHYRARIGPDACSGLGSPIGTKLAELFQAVAQQPHGVPERVISAASKSHSYVHAAETAAAK
jgi:subtilase family serine protease